MRITNNMIQQTATSAMQQNLQLVAKAQNQVSTGQEYASFADDPEAQSSVMQTTGAIRALDQYTRNVNDATARANSEDSVLSQLGDTIDRAKQIAIEEGSSTASASDRAAAQSEVSGLLDFVVSLGNTQYGNEYLFGGDNAATPPLSDTPPFYTTPSAPSGVHTTEISAGQLFQSNHNAKQVFLDTNVLQSLQDLSDGLASNDQTKISASIDSLSNAQQSVQGLVGDLGARLDQLNVTSSNISALETNLKTFKSNLSDADQEQAVTDLLSHQTTYQSAMLATSRVIGMTLTDYLQ